MFAEVCQTHGAVHLVPTGLEAPTASALLVASLPRPVPRSSPEEESHQDTRCGVQLGF